MTPELLDRLRAELELRGLDQAVLSQPETLASLVGFAAPMEDWPVANPFAVCPAVLMVGPSDAVLVVADFYAGHAREGPARVVAHRSYDFRSAPDPPGELRRAVLAALDDAGLSAGRTGVEASGLPLAAAEWLREAGLELVAIDDVVVAARRVKLPVELEAIRRASRLADIVQQAVKDHAAPGLSEAHLAGLAAAAMYREAGRRLPAILTVTAGEATSTGGGEATGRIIGPGDLVLTDTSPWIDGAWSDTANAVCVGTPDAATRRRFDAVRSALELGIALCKPGAIARAVDRKVREALEEHGPTYRHHTGHGIGAAWSEEPRITPYNDMRIEEGMVLALEPAVYLPGWGGIRLEHVFLVRSAGNEILTLFEHTL